jgi:hypothetical protein
MPLGRSRSLPVAARPMLLARCRGTLLARWRRMLVYSRAILLPYRTLFNPTGTGLVDTTGARAIDAAGLIRAGRACRTARKIPSPFHVAAQLLPEMPGIMLPHPDVGADDGGALVDVDAAPVVNVRPGTANPAAAAPAVVINPVPAPIQVAAEPGADGKPRAESDESIGGTRLDVHDLRVIHGNIDVLGYGRHNPDVSRLDDHLLLAG